MLLFRVVLEQAEHTVSSQACPFFILYKCITITNLLYIQALTSSMPSIPSPTDIDTRVITKPCSARTHPTQKHPVHYSTSFIHRVRISESRLCIQRPHFNRAWCFDVGDRGRHNDNIMSDTNSLYYAFAPAQCPARAGCSSAVMDRQSQSHTDDGIFHTSRVNEGSATMLHKMGDHDPPPDRIRLAF